MFFIWKISTGGYYSSDKTQKLDIFKIPLNITTAISILPEYLKREKTENINRGK